MRRLFGLAAFVYVDDVFVAEPIGTVGSAREVFKAVCELFGLRLAPAKSQGPAPSIHLIGAQIVFGAGHMSACLPTRRKTDLANDIRQILQRNQLNPAQASKLRGRLGFFAIVVIWESGPCVVASPYPTSIFQGRG